MAGKKIKGKGDYNTFNLRGLAGRLDQALSSIPKGAFARKGAELGSKYGVMGALAGKGLGAGLAAVTGYGNYSVRANSLSKVSTSIDMIPQFVKNDHSIRVTHREFIKDLVVPADPASFSLQSFLINPANAALFPWLATMAKQYSQYKIHGMVFAYKTMSSDITAGGSLGTVVMATNYNAIDRAFINKIEMENSEFAVSTKPSMSLVHAIECDPKYTGLEVLYVRDPSYETADTNDRRFYDYGRFQLATTGLPGLPGTTMGELWVSYDIEFMKPVIGGSGLPGLIQGTSLVSKADGTTAVGVIDQDVQRITLTSGATNPTSNATQNLLSSDNVYLAGGDTGLKDTVVSTTATTIVLRKNGYYVVRLRGKATSSSAGFRLPFRGASAAITLPSTTTGAAVASVVASGYNTISSCGAEVLPADPFGYSYATEWTITVTGISLAGDTVVLTPSTFLLDSTQLVTSLTKVVDVQWYVKGSNDQVATFVPS